MKKYGILQRTISLLLSLVLVASCLPAGLLTAKAADEDAGAISAEIVTDPSTLNTWSDTAFNPEDLTTEHAGGVWTDKTVLKQGDIANAFRGVSGLGVADNNFLVALSALGANSVVAGQGATPTDTIFVLDVSNSMGDGDLLAMVNATNDAIHSLLTTNEESRIGVVVYATDVNTLLPLDRYTPVQKGADTNTTNDDEIAYIEMNDSYSQIRTARITEWQWSGGIFGSYQEVITDVIKNGNGRDVTTSISASGATYIQGGLWQAYQMFNNATVSDSRAPVLVLMSDGAPTYGTEDFNNVTSRDVGNGGTNSVTDGLAFLTQLTAAYVKEKISDKYGVPSYFYSVGLNISENGQQVSIAEAVLDTSETRANIESNWTTYLGLATAQNKTMSFNAAGENVTVTYDSTIAETSKTYTDRYFSADDASQLSSAFQGIVNEINLKSSYTVTRLEGVDVNTNGYVTFVDEIGAGMEVKDIKGILIGNHLFSGEMLAKATEDGDFGTEAAPTALGLNQVWALQNRLRIEATDAQTAAQRVWELLRQARAAGQIRYSANSYSNYIGWFGDADGKFVDFWDTEDETPAIPAGATHANMCYGMLGTTTDSQTAHASDMMYVAITVSKAITDGKIKVTTPQTVTFRIPASLLPTVTYQIDVQAANDEAITESTPATITYDPAEPIRLLYEVGVHSDLTPLNVQEFLGSTYANKDSNGNYYLYTNAWHQSSDNDALFDTSKNHITYAYFEPGLENEHYYYTEDTALYTKNGSTYTKLTTAPVTDGSVQYYFQHKVFESKQSANQTGVAVDAQVNVHYGAVSKKLLQTAGNVAQGNDGVYYVKAGTMHYETIHDHDKEKGQNNPTGSFGYRLHQLVDIAVAGDTSHHYEIAYLGNNGRITYAPAQGLKLSKVMNDGSAPDATFTFEVALTAPVGQTLASAYETVHVARNGAETSGSANVEAGKLTVTIKPGESIYILGLPTGTTYTVTEQKTAGYRLESSTATSGTVANNTISEAVFTNVVRQAGALTVSKWVTYEKGVDPTGDTNEFDVTVTLKDGAENFVGELTVNGQPYNVTNGAVTFKISHNQSVVIAGIPEGVTYTVAEDTSEENMPKGHTFNANDSVGLTGAMDADGEVAGLSNTYTPDDVIIDSNGTDLVLNVKKNYIHESTATGQYQFDFELQRYDSANQKWRPIDADDTVFSNPTESSQPYTQDDIVLEALGEHLTAVGDYYFRIAEVIPDAEDQLPGMTYDRAHHDFKVVVTDKTFDGKLEIDDVVAVDDTVTVTHYPSATNPDASYWAVATEFTNRYQTHSTKLTLGATKTLTGATLKDGQFSFALYETDDSYDITGKTPVQVKNGANGDIVFPAITYKYGDLTGEYTYYHYVMAELDAEGNPLPADQPYIRNGVTYTPHTYHINVSVHKETQGEAVAQVNYVRYKRSDSINWNMANITSGAFNEITFQNTYEAEDTTYQISGNKTLTNLTPGVANTEMIVPGDTYNFTIEAVSNSAPLPAQTTVAAAQNGAITFPAITFDTVGTYTYKISENDTTAPGVTKDNTVYTVEITVTDDGEGQLHASAVYFKDGAHIPAITFNNTYVAAPTGDVVLGGGKRLTVKEGSHRDLQSGEFFFTLEKPDGTTETVSNTLENGTRFAFSPITFDTVGHYTYTIREVIPHGAVNKKLNGITYASAPLSVPIEVYDDGSGTLKVRTPTGSLNSEGNFNYAVHFENFYEAENAVISLLAHKDLEGRDLNASEFTFQIEALTTGAPVPANPVVANDENGNVEFKDITFTAVGTYQYKVTELDANKGALTDSYTHKGVTYSQKVYTVTVTVRDTGNGNLVARVSSVDENGNAQPGGVVFTNSYNAAPVKAEITATKELYNTTGGNNIPLGVPGNTYQFKLEALEGAPAPVADTVYAAAGGAISFGEIEFSEAGTYTYRLTEVDNGRGGITYDPSVYAVELKIRDNLEGNLEVDSITYTKGGSDTPAAVFTNKYAAASVTAQITAQKILTNRTPGVAQTPMSVPADTYKFKLEAVTADAPLPAQPEVFAAEGGAITFPAITYTNPGVFVYTLRELDMQIPGVATDNTVYTVTVTVEDNDAGQLAVTSLVYAEETTPVTEGLFENTYVAAPVEIHVEGTSAATDGKIFTDESSLPENKKDMDDYAFEFVLAELNGDVVQRVTDNGQGFSFDAVEFTQAGTYQYQIYERPGNDAGIIYDYAKYRVTVTVTDNGLGQLEAAVVYEKSESIESDDYQPVAGILFQNSYKAKETTHVITGTKLLTGRDLAEGEFTFVLKDATTKQILVSAKNDASGNILFPTATYNAEGTFTYLLEEKNDGQEGITYDETQYLLTVTVVDVNGELVANTVITANGKVAESLIFHNLCETSGGVPGIPEPTEPEPTEPEPTEPKPTEPKPTEPKPTEPKPTEPKPTEPEPTEPKPTEPKPTEPKPTEPKPTEPKPTEPKPTEPEIDSPQTGDTFHLGAWTLMLCISAIGMLAVLLLGKKKESIQ